MKKNLFTVLVSFALTTTAYSQSIPNNSFETWTNGKTPDGWNNEYAQPDSTILKESIAFDGSFAMKVRVHHVNTFNTDEFAYVTSRFGISASSQPQNLTFYYKANIVAGDSSKIYLNLFNSGSLIGTAVWRAGQQSIISNYLFKGVPINYTSGAIPDSAEIIIIGGDAENAAQKNGTYIILDKIEFDGINLVAGIFEDKGEIQGLKLFPNPAGETVSLIFNPILSSSLTVKVYDILGKEVLGNEIPGNNAILNLSNLETGIYIVTVAQGELKNQYKLIKQ